MIRFDENKIIIKGKANIQRGCFGHFAGISFDRSDNPELLKLAENISGKEANYSYSICPEDLILLLYKLPAVKNGDIIHHFEAGNIKITIEFDNSKELRNAKT